MDVPSFDRDPDLSVGPDRLAMWNIPERRRASFRRLHLINRRGLALRSGAVSRLDSTPLAAIGEVPEICQLAGRGDFCAIVLVQGDRIRFEHYAADFGPDDVHSIQSITKTLAHMIIGDLIGRGRIDPDQPFGDYLPEAGPAYREASIQQVLDMALATNFSDDYAAAYETTSLPGEPVGYARQEIAMGWRLPPEGEAEFGLRSFLSGLVSTGPAAPDGPIRYASPNTDALGWFAERVAGEPLAVLIGRIIEAAGLSGAFHIALDCDHVPVLSGGGSMTALDLARYGLLLARGGVGLSGARVGNPDFLADAMGGAGTRYGEPGSPIRYRNHLFAARRWVGHAGYGGQFLMVDPEKEAAAVYLSVLETPTGSLPGHFATIIAALEQALDRL